MSDLRVVTALDEGGGSWGKAACARACSLSKQSGERKGEKHIKDEGTKSHDFVPPDLKN
jgi:hypothetical protein